MEWISVQDRLPEGDGHYLTFSHYYGVRGMDYDCLEGWAKRQWFFDDTSPTSTVTHWMPLPEPPKED